MQDYYYPTDDHPITVAPQVQPNIVAPIVTYQGSMQWLTPRTVAIAFGGVVITALALMVGRNAGTQPETIRVSPVKNLEPSSADVNRVILENSKASLDELKIATNLKIQEVQQASINERSQEILNESKRQVSDPKSGCYRSTFGTKCFLTAYLAEQELRYSNAIAVRNWNDSNNALFNVQAARVAMDGIKPSKFEPAMVTAAIRTENDARINIAQQSDNAIAADMFEVGK